MPIPIPLGVSGYSKLSETLPTRRRPHPTFSGANHSARPSTTPAALGAAPFQQAPRLFMQTAPPSMVHPGTQGTHHIRDVSLRPVSQRPLSICGCAATDRCCARLPLRLPHPVASRALRVRMMLQSAANTLPNTTTPPPPGSSPLASTQFDDISRQAQEGCDNIRKTVSCSAPRYCNHEPSDHHIWRAMSLGRLQN